MVPTCNAGSAARTYRGCRDRRASAKEVPPEWKADKSELIAYLQRPATLEILGAAKADFRRSGAWKY